MSSEQRMYSLEYRLFAENYFHIIYTAMKKCYYEGPTFKLWGGVIGPGSRVRGSWVRFYTMPIDQIGQNIFFAYIIFIC